MASDTYVLTPPKQDGETIEETPFGSMRTLVQNERMRLTDMLYKHRETPWRLARYECFLEASGGVLALITKLRSESVHRLTITFHDGPDDYPREFPTWEAAWQWLIENHTLYAQDE